MRARYVRVQDACDQLCCSRSKFYEKFVATGVIEIKHSFGSTLASQESIDRYYDNLPAAKPRAAPYAKAPRRSGRQKAAPAALVAAE